PIAQNKLITIENKIPSDLIINADINMTKTIIRNLISNAIKYSKVGGKIIINSEKKDNETIIYVEDFGVGMSEKEVDDIFLPNNTQSKEGTMGEKGTGFGLLICNELVLKQNGKIWIESEEGKGSKFIFSLPN
ncbi:MAG TPA: PAS domain-containing sensor histidine kinase, partial [Bacteroidales bacterium]|nr:PAS domain-containing sensor histidine kinase [Bacteroidales bacterium]